MNPDELQSADVDSAPDEALMAELAALAASISAEPSFVAALEARLQQAQRASQAQPAPTWRQRFMQPRLVYRLAFALLLCLLVAIPVLASGALRFFVPVEATQFPSSFTPNPIGNAAVQPIASRNSKDLAKAVGFSILSPIDLPPDCKLLQYAYSAEPRAAFLSYSCVDVLEQKALPDWRQNPLRQPVGPNAVQELTINGRPAYYIEGAWQFNGTRTPPIWKPADARRLVFERGELLIDIAAIPDAIVNGVVRGLISKEELIRIAQSMK